MNVDAGSTDAIGDGRAARPPAGHAYRPEVDGLRAVAVVPVILFHAGFEAFSGGYVGVDVFFVISGYLITTIILTERLAGRFSIVNFYERRARRILPALFALLLVTVPVAWWWMLPGELAAFGDSVWGVALFVSNLVFWRTSGYFGGAEELKPLLHTWSLGIEEQYYLFFPLLVMLVLRWGLGRLIAVLSLVALGSLALSVFLTTRQPMMNFFLPPTRAWELLAGSLLAACAVAGWLPRSGRALREIGGFAGLALILVPVFLYGEETPFPGLSAVPPVLGTVLLLAFADGQSGAGRLLSARPVVGVGLISYSAYLWHQPLFAFARMATPGTLSAAAYLALAGGALVAAWLSWKYIEAPFRNRRNFTRQQIFAMAAVGSLLFVGIGGALSLSQGAPGRFEARHLALVAPAEGLLEGCPEVAAGLHECAIGVPGKEPTIAMVGDSHSYALAKVLDAELKARGLASVVVHTSCHPIPGVFDSREPLDVRFRSYCEAANEAMVSRVTRPPISTTIVAIRWTLRLVPMGDATAAAFDNGEGGVERDTPFRRNLTFDAAGNATAAAAGKVAAVSGFVERLAAAQKVVLVYPVPEVGWTPARLNMIALARGGEPPASISTSQARYRARNEAAIRILDAIAAPNVSRVRTEQLFCGAPLEGRCIVQRGSTSYYLDDDHVSTAGARLIVREALSKI